VTAAMIDSQSVRMRRRSARCPRVERGGNLLKHSLDWLLRFHEELLARRLRGLIQAEGHKALRRPCRGDHALLEL
jgi:hypothetical protein